MTTFGYALSSEEFTPQELLRQAGRAERAGFEALWISDHYHPWNKEQGEAAFVWAVIGALATTTTLPVTSAVTCPTMRIHPAIIAQAAATAQVMHEGRFRLGVGTGEALNEQILGDHWPSAPVRLEMLEEAIEVMRRLWAGETLEHYGVHYVVQNAHVYTRHETPPPLIVSGFNPKAIALAAEVGDGYCNTAPDADAVRAFREGGGGDKVCQGSIKVCWGEDEAAARRTAHRLWPNAALPGELSQILPTPPHFEQAASLVTEDMVAEVFPCGPDLDRHVAAIQRYVDAGYDEVYIQQIGPEQDAFFEVYEREVLPRLR